MKLYGREAVAASTHRTAGDPWSPLLLFALLSDGEGLLIAASNVLLALFCRREWDGQLYTRAAIAGFGVTLLFALIRPMIRFSTASDWVAAIIARSVRETLTALALAELGALGAHVYLTHYFGTTIPPVSFQTGVSLGGSDRRRRPGRFCRRPAVGAVAARGPLGAADRRL